jgi:hypothetical protein
MNSLKPKLIKGLLAGGMFLFFGRLKRSKVQAARKLEFFASSQRFGLFFPDALRNKYRRKWLKTK